MVPDAWLPTCTVVTAWSVPVAVTVLRKLPRSTFAVMYSAALAPLPQYQTPPSATSATTRPTTARRLFLFRNDFTRCIFFSPAGASHVRRTYVRKNVGAKSRPNKLDTGPRRSVTGAGAVNLGVRIWPPARV